VIGIVGPAFSGGPKAVLPALQEAGLGDDLGVGDQRRAADRRTQRARVPPCDADDALQASGGREYLATKLKPKSVAYVKTDTEYGKGLATDARSSRGQGRQDRCH